MWKKCPNNNSLFISFSHKDEFEINVTDYLTLWFVTYSEKEFVRCLQDSNAAELELDENGFKEKGILMLSNPESLKKFEFKIEAKHLKLQMSRSFGYPLKINLNLTEGSKEMFFYKITQPLLKMIQDFKSSESELRHLLKKKDLEIEEYKSEGGHVAKHFKTPKFNEEEHMNKYNSYGKCFGLSNIPNTLVAKMVIPPEEDVKIKSEPVEVIVKKEQAGNEIKCENPIHATRSTSTIQATLTIKRELSKTESDSTLVNIKKRRNKKLNL